MPVTGAKEVAAVLRRISSTPTSAEARKARHTALEVVRQAARQNLAANHSVITGALSKGLGYGEKDARTTALGSVVGTKHATVGHLVEFGTRPHFQPRRLGGIHHPGARPKPWMRPAFELHKEEVMKILAREILHGLERFLGKL